MRLYDTKRRQIVELVPRDPGHATLYCCGPTVYSPVHVGNARPFVLFAVLRRALRRRGLAVTWVCNVTDVNDKIYARAREEGRSSVEAARDYTAQYVADTDLLGFDRPDVEPLATESLPEIVALIEALVARDAAYASGGDVYFRVAAAAGYGGLSRRDVGEMRERATAAGIEFDDEAESAAERARKDDPLDFALWKGAKPDEDHHWDSPWGRGRPGWHIECSAMAERHLGLGFDVHGGGLDLLFPHHENEAAQTLAARDAELCRIWMHNGMVRADDGADKMGKSEGNAFGLRDAVTAHGAPALLLLLHNAHYRAPVDWSASAIAQAEGGVRRLTEALRRRGRDGDAGDGRGDVGPDPAPFVTEFDAAFDDDLHTPRALAACFGLASALNRAESGARRARAALVEMLDVLGLAGLADARDVSAPVEVVELAEERGRARSSRDFAAADRLRDQIAALGWTVRDRGEPPGYELVPA